MTFKNQGQLCMQGKAETAVGWRTWERSGTIGVAESSQAQTMRPDRMKGDLYWFEMKLEKSHLAEVPTDKWSFSRHSSGMRKLHWQDGTHQGGATPKYRRGI